ncbi:transglycosylase domain-containing protein [Alkalicoccus luteus]|uniref:transglycosylase domain-containing protein n=1 Tax=Alkalicoccus luteus TaxID=1237094 RepID=UPI00403350D7
MIRTGLGFTAVAALAAAFTFLSGELLKQIPETPTIHEVLDEEIQFDAAAMTLNSRIMDRHGVLVSDVYSGENRIFTPLHEMPEVAANMFLAVEDRNFYEHRGFDGNGIARALMVNLQAQEIDQGGSTITQQVARNLYLTHEQTYERKLSEILYAYQMEREMSKEDILELYMNSIYFANGVYGFESASQFYFSRPSSELSLAEITFLGAIPNSPSRFDPLVNSEATMERQEVMLERMVSAGILSESQISEALDEQIVLDLSERTDDFPDYVSYVHHEFEELLIDQENLDREAASERAQKLLQQGVIIETALDPTIQNAVTEVINDRFSTSDIQAAASVIDHETNEITAITGGTAYQKFDFHRGWQASRSPGSTIKPLLSFGPYMDETGENKAGSYIDSGPFSKNDYRPRNFGGAEYGVVTLEQAFKQSHNTAAVRMLDKISPETGFSYLRKFDFPTLKEEDIRLPAALGGFSEGMSVNDMTRAYTVFQQKGEYRTPRAIRQVTTLDGDVIVEGESASIRVYSEETADTIRGMMKRTVESGTGTAAHYDTAGYLGGKTGTSDEYHDLWFIGSNDWYTTGIWIGRDQPQSLESQSRDQVHTRLWRSIMQELPTAP